MKDLKKGTPPARITTGKNFLYTADAYTTARLYIVTNEDAPRYRVFVAEAGNSSATTGKKSFRRPDAVLQGAAVWGGKIFAQYEQERDSQLKISTLRERSCAIIALPAIGTVFGVGRQMGPRRNFLSAFSRSRFRPRFTVTTCK